MSQSAEELVKQGDVTGALQALQDKVRSNPADAKARVFLFQLLSVLGNWDRALTQLNVAADIDPTTLLMAQVCRPALQCESFREHVFAGETSPLFLGEPPAWAGRMVEALKLFATGSAEQASTLRAAALDEADAIGGTFNGDRFEWMADGDDRLGPILEIVTEGRYYWVPIQNIARIEIEPPADLRDVVFLPARFVWVNGGTAVGLIPTRYPGTQSSEDGQLLLARKTEWVEHADGTYTGLGQRMLVTDSGEHPLLEARSVVFDTFDEAQRLAEAQLAVGETQGEGDG
ncbi:MAG: type VI secretion system accessory protein TagJ [Planctomycetota bacterium]